MSGVTLTFGRKLKADQLGYAHELIRLNIGMFRFSDPQTVLIDRQSSIAGEWLSSLSREFKRDVTLQIEMIGRIIKLDNGKRYRNTPDGWVEIADTAEDHALQLAYQRR